jgi:hypothetical protein
VGGGVLVALGVTAASGRGAAQSSLELAVKASYLAKFAPFVEWPATAPASPKFAICVVGRDPFGPLIDRAVAGQSLGGKPLMIERLKVADPQAPCRIAFIGGSRQQPVKDAVRVLKGAPVLTVTDGSDAAGVIEFVVSGGRVRFRVDDGIAADDGLTISSKLLSLALSVTPRTGKGVAR